MEEAPVNACSPGFRPWVHFFFLLFLHFCVYSAFISEKLQPASGDCLSPLGVRVTGLSPTDQSITMNPAFSAMRPTMSSSALHESPTVTSDHARCSVSLFKEKGGQLSSALLLTRTFGFCSEGKPPAATFCHLKHTFFSRPQQLNLSRWSLLGLTDISVSHFPTFPWALLGILQANRLPVFSNWSFLAIGRHDVSKPSGSALAPGPIGQSSYHLGRHLPKSWLHWLAKFPAALPPVASLAYAVVHFTQ